MDLGISDKRPLVTGSSSGLARAIALCLADEHSWAEIERGTVRDIMPNDIGRLGHPEEIAAAVAYLANRLADHVSGAVLRFDGGAVRSVN